MLQLQIHLDSWRTCGTDLQVSDGVVHLLLLFVGSLRVFIGRLPARVQIFFSSLQLSFSLL